MEPHQISSIQDELKTYNDNVARISDLHNRSLNNTDEAAAQRHVQQMEDLVADTSALSNMLKRRIKALEKQGGSGRDGQIRKQQVRSRNSSQSLWEANRCLTLLLDWPGEAEVCGSDPKLPDG